ncbi:YhcH/YjgK/YiaL family protein [Clostridium sp. AM58-1XD]|uniref:YhcH/YjgK/YiaL family protein n=1 Tax=Clostridium sp. AM58-1XD TaxID=2292307 RepID=UPI0015F6F8F4|nr:YhcH/YjgK/YiaL family protein [Clostridium sp. AM58-1XD]
MIIDFIRNRSWYEEDRPLLKTVFDFAEKIKGNDPGRYECGDLYAMVQKGITKPSEEGSLEAHHDYIDLQYVVSGQEIMEWKNTEDLIQETPYDEKKDIVFFKGTGMPAVIEPGMFYLVFPQDGHKPCVHMERPSEYKKVVVKIRTDLWK